MPKPTLKERWPELAGIATQQTFQKNSEIFCLGATPQAVYFVNRGLVKLRRVEPDGREMIANLRSSGHLVGVASAIAQTQYNLSAVALLECETQRIPVGAFIELVKNDAQLSWRVNQMSCRNIISLNARLTHVAELRAGSIWSTCCGIFFRSSISGARIYHRPTLASHYPSTTKRSPSCSQSLRNMSASYSGS